MTENLREFDDDFYDDEDEDTQKDKYLTFQLGSEEYGIAINFVTEVVGMQRITAIPDLPDFMRGVINLRGQVIPVMDVRARFKMDPKEYDDRTCVVVVNIEETSIGLVVDEVDEVLDVPAENIEPPPRLGQASSSRFIQGLGKVGEEVRILLDVSKLLFEHELEQISAAQ